MLDITVFLSILSSFVLERKSTWRQFGSFSDLALVRWGQSSVSFSPTSESKTLVSAALNTPFIVRFPLWFAGASIIPSLA